MPVVLPKTKSQAIKKYCYWGNSLARRKAAVENFSKVVDREGLGIGSHGHMCRGPYEDAKIPIGPFVGLVRSKSRHRIFASFKHVEKTHSKRQIALQSPGAISFLLKACKIELLKAPGNKVLSLNIRRLRCAEKAIEVIRKDQGKYSQLPAIPRVQPQ